jgi:ketosteroid isomerase-like protein
MKEGLTPLSEEFVKRFESNDLEGVVALYAADAVLYPPDATEAIGTEAIRKAWGGLMNAFTVQKLIIAAASHEIHGDTAFGWGKFAMILIPKGGGETVRMEGRFTDVSKRVNDRWLYIFDHASIPLPPQH